MIEEYVEAYDAYMKAIIETKNVITISTYAERKKIVNWLVVNDLSKNLEDIFKNICHSSIDDLMYLIDLNVKGTLSLQDISKALEDPERYSIRLNDIRLKETSCKIVEFFKSNRWKLRVLSMTVVFTLVISACQL